MKIRKLGFKLKLQCINRQIVFGHAAAQSKTKTIESNNQYIDPQLKQNRP